MKIYKWFLIISALFIFTFGILMAQDESDQEKSDDETEDVLIVQTRIRFTNKGRQDPFIDLEVQKREREQIEEAQIEPIPPFDVRQKMYPGVRGMLVRELTLNGIVKGADDFVAMFQGIDGKAHFLREGDELYNSKVLKIKMDNVVFEHYKRYINKSVETDLITVTIHE